ncbi:hypothetical protein MHB78_01065 [Bacillus sp. FSL K6-0138]|nr:hypothetical protein [Bacillus glycinifermentans]
MPRIFWGFVLLNWNIGFEIHSVGGMKLIRFTFLPFTVIVRIGGTEK